MDEDFLIGLIDDGYRADGNVASSDAQINEQMKPDMAEGSVMSDAGSEYMDYINEKYGNKEREL